MGSGLYLCLCHPALQCKLSTLACQNKYFPSPWFLLRQEVNPHSAVVHSCRLSMHTVLANTDSSSQEKLTPGWIHYSDTFLSSASISSLPNSNLSLPSAHLGFSSLYIPVVHSTLLYLQVQAGFADPNWFLPFSISGRFHCAAWGARAGTACEGMQQVSSFWSQQPQPLPVCNECWAWPGWRESPVSLLKGKGHKLEVWWCTRHILTVQDQYSNFLSNFFPERTQFTLLCHFAQRNLCPCAQPALGCGGLWQQYSLTHNYFCHEISKITEISYQCWICSAIKSDIFTYIWVGFDKCSHSPQKLGVVKAKNKLCWCANSSAGKSQLTM